MTSVQALLLEALRHAKLAREAVEDDLALVKRIQEVVWELQDMTGEDD